MRLCRLVFSSAIILSLTKQPKSRHLLEANGKRFLASVGRGGAKRDDSLLLISTQDSDGVTETADSRHTEQHDTNTIDRLAKGTVTLITSETDDHATASDVLPARQHTYVIEDAHQTKVLPSDVTQDRLHNGNPAQNIKQQLAHTSYKLATQTSMYDHNEAQRDTVTMQKYPWGRFRKTYFNISEKQFLSKISDDKGLKKADGLTFEEKNILNVLLHAVHNDLPNENMIKGNDDADDRHTGTSSTVEKKKREKNVKGDAIYIYVPTDSRNQQKTFSDQRQQTETHWPSRRLTEEHSLREDKHFQVQSVFDSSLNERLRRQSHDDDDNNDDDDNDEEDSEQKKDSTPSQATADVVVLDLNQPDTKPTTPNNAQTMAENLEEQEEAIGQLSKMLAKAMLEENRGGLQHGDSLALIENAEQAEKDEEEDYDHDSQAEEDQVLADLNQGQNDDSAVTIPSDVEAEDVLVETLQFADDDTERRRRNTNTDRAKLIRDFSVKQSDDLFFQTSPDIPQQDSAAQHQDFADGGDADDSTPDRTVHENADDKRNEVHSIEDGDHLSHSNTQEHDTSEHYHGIQPSQDQGSKAIHQLITANPVHSKAKHQRITTNPVHSMAEHQLITTNPVHSKAKHQLITINPFQSKAKQQLITINPVHSVAKHQLITTNPVHSKAKHQLITTNPVHSMAKHQLITTNPVHSKAKHQLITTNPSHSKPKQQLITINPVHSEAKHQLITTNPSHSKPKQQLITINPVHSVAKHQLITTNPVRNTAKHQLPVHRRKHTQRGLLFQICTLQLVANRDVKQSVAKHTLKTSNYRQSKADTKLHDILTAKKGKGKLMMPAKTLAARQRHDDGGSRHNSADSDQPIKIIQVIVAKEERNGVTSGVEIIEMKGTDERGSENMNVQQSHRHLPSKSKYTATTKDTQKSQAIQLIKLKEAADQDSGDHNEIKWRNDIQSHKSWKKPEIKHFHIRKKDSTNHRRSNTVSKANNESQTGEMNTTTKRHNTIRQDPHHRPKTLTSNKNSGRKKPTGNDMTEHGVQAETANNSDASTDDVNTGKVQAHFGNVQLDNETENGITTEFNNNTSEIQSTEPQTYHQDGAKTGETDGNSTNRVLNYQAAVKTQASYIQPQDNNQHANFQVIYNRPHHIMLRTPHKYTPRTDVQNTVIEENQDKHTQEIKIETAKFQPQLQDITVINEEETPETNENTEVKPRKHKTKSATEQQDNHGINQHKHTMEQNTATEGKHQKHKQEIKIKATKFQPQLQDITIINEEETPETNENTEVKPRKHKTKSATEQQDNNVINQHKHTMEQTTPGTANKCECDNELQDVQTGNEEESEPQRNTQGHDAKKTKKQQQKKPKHDDTDKKENVQQVRQGDNDDEEEPRRGTVAKSHKKVHKFATDQDGKLPHQNSNDDEEQLRSLGNTSPPAENVNQDDTDIDEQANRKADDKRGQQKRPKNKIQQNQNRSDKRKYKGHQHDDRYLHDSKHEQHTHGETSSDETNQTQKKDEGLSHKKKQKQSKGGQDNLNEIGPDGQDNLDEIGPDGQDNLDEIGPEDKKHNQKVGKDSDQTKQTQNKDDGAYTDKSRPKQYTADDEYSDNKRPKNNKAHDKHHYETRQNKKKEYSDDTKSKQYDMRSNKSAQKTNKLKRPEQRKDDETSTKNKNPRKHNSDKKHANKTKAKKKPKPKSNLKLTGQHGNNDKSSTKKHKGRGKTAAKENPVKSHVGKKPKTKSSGKPKDLNEHNNHKTAKLSYRQKTRHITKPDKELKGLEVEREWTEKLYDDYDTDEQKVTHVSSWKN